MKWDRSQVVAVITGAIALLLGLLYLAVVTALDFRGEMQPAPLELTLSAIQATLHRVTPWLPPLP